MEAAIPALRGLRPLPPALPAWRAAPWRARCATASLRNDLSANVSFEASSPAQRRAFVRKRCQNANVATTTDDASLPVSESKSQDLVDLIAQGVLSHKAGATADRVAALVDDWCALGNKLSDFLDFRPDQLSEAEKVRIYQYYLPIFFWCQDQLSGHRSRFADGVPVPPLVIGINAPQGCGKTTVVESLAFLFNSTGRSTAAISVDDFYLIGAEQEKLAKDNPDNGLLEFRGNAGSHDLEFGTQTIKAFLDLNTKGSQAKVPRYDKASRSGRGDRADPSTWPVVDGPLEVLLFEGWMLGYEPQDHKTVTSIDPQLGLVNDLLEGYYEAWYRYVNSWIIIQVEDPSWVFEWRLEAEVQMRKKGRGGMTDGEVAEFVSTYMPAYKAYLPSLYSSGPKNSTAENTLKFSINKDRNPIA